MEVDPSSIQRLSFIRYLYLVAVEQSRQPDPLAAASVLSFHDSVELFLQLASEQLNVGRNRMEFMQYWEVIDPALDPNRLSQRESMRRLNSARVSLKHHGTLPSVLAIEQFRSSVGSFFEENTRVVFGVEFEGLSLVDLVTCEVARESLREAVKQIQEGDTGKSTISAAIAFEQLKDDVNDRLKARYYRTPFWFGDSFDFDKSFFRHRPVPDPQQDKFEDKVVEAIVAMQEVMGALGFGLDYRRYARFRLLTPSVSRSLAGKYHVQIVQGLPGRAGRPYHPPPIPNSA